MYIENDPWVFIASWLTPVKFNPLIVKITIEILKPVEFSLQTLSRSVRFS